MLPVSLVSPAAVMLEESASGVLEGAPSTVGIIPGLEVILTDEIESTHVSPPNFSSSMAFLIDLELSPASLSESPGQTSWESEVTSEKFHGITDLSSRHSELHLAVLEMYP